MTELKAQLTAIWQKPGVENPGNINIWYVPDGYSTPVAKPGSKRRPAWDKALLKRARIHLPNWFANKSKPY